MDTDAIPAVYELETIEQLRAIADELRVRIVGLLTRRAMTVTQLGDALGVAPAKAHYHVRELERVGLVRLVETRERGGILEKYYRAVAQDIRASKSLLQASPPDEATTAIAGQLQSITGGFMRAFARALAEPDGPNNYIQLSSGLVWLTDDEMRAVAQRMADLLEPYRDPRPAVGATPRMTLQLSYELAGNEGTEEGAGAGDSAQPAHPSTSHPTPPGRHRVFSVGGASYCRADLERVVAAGEALEIMAVGALTFAEDVPPALAERAIAHVRVRGILSASPEVRAVIERKTTRPQPREEA